MKIRLATINDIPECVELGRQFHAFTRFREYKFNPDRLSKSLAAVVNDRGGNYVFFVAEDSQGVLVGALIAGLQRHFFSDKVYASIVHYDVLPDKRMSGAGLRLMRAFQSWSKGKNVFELCAGVNSGTNIDVLDQYFSKLGFQKIGGNYALKLKKHEP